MRPTAPARTRRQFIESSTKAASVLAIPAVFVSTANAAADPRDANSKIRVGLIGAGNRAKWLTRALARESCSASVPAQAGRGAPCVSAP